MPIFKVDDTYKGTFDVCEPNWPEIATENKSREVVEWKLRLEFAQRLKKLTRDAALLRMLLADIEWDWLDNDSVMQARAPEIVEELAKGLHDLMDCEPGLALCATRKESMLLETEHGDEVELDYGDCQGPIRAIEDRVERAWQDTHDHAFTRAFDAVTQKGICGPKVAATVQWLTEYGIRDAGGKFNAEAHVRAVAAVAGGSSWTKHVNHERGVVDEPDAYSALLYWYRSDYKYEVMTPAERAKEDRLRAKAKRTLAAFGYADTQKPKRTIAAKRTVRPKARRAS